jgi:hypothetical protein
MELWARWAHKALWHDFQPGWALHKSHHEPRLGPFEVGGGPGSQACATQCPGWGHAPAAARAVSLPVVAWLAEPGGAGRVQEAWPALRVWARDAPLTRTRR